MKNMRNLKIKLILSALVMALPGCSGFNLGQISGGFNLGQADSLLKAGKKLVSAVGPMSEEQEYYLGRSVSAIILSQNKLYNNPTQTNYVNTVGNALAAFSERPETFGGYHFAVLDSTQVNAVSAPGGFVFISKGFLNVIPDEDALAAVLAHEIGHIVKGHGLKAISQANLSEALLILGKEAASSYGASQTQALASAFGNSVTDITGKLLKDGYSRSQEYEADEYAAELLSKAGYSSSSLISMLRAIGDSAKSDKSGGWFATHPGPDDRISELGADLPTADGSSINLRATRFKSIIR